MDTTEPLSRTTASADARAAGLTESQGSRGGVHQPPQQLLSTSVDGAPTIESGRNAPRPCPRVLLLSCDERKLSSLSPFQRKEGCDRIGKVARCEKLRDGGLEVEFRDEKDAENAMKTTVFTYTVRDARGKRQVRLPIHVSPHRTKIAVVELSSVQISQISRTRSPLASLSSGLLVRDEFAPRRAAHWCPLIASSLLSTQRTSRRNCMLVMRC